MTTNRSSQPGPESGKKRAVIYARVSTTEQTETAGDDKGYSIHAQQDYCERKADELEAEVVETYTDRGESARSADRPELQRMLARIRTETCWTHPLGLRYVRDREYAMGELVTMLEARGLKGKPRSTTPSTSQSMSQPSHNHKNTPRHSWKRSQPSPLLRLTEPTSR